MEQNTADGFRQLAAHFPADAVSWRVGSTTSDKTKGMALAYIDSRDVQERLDAVVGPENWSDSYHETARGIMICTLSICINGQWISKSDGAGATDVEAEKGIISDAFKRAAVKWGIGRYLYSLPSPWVEIEQRGKTSVISEAGHKKLQEILMREARRDYQAPPAAKSAPPRDPKVTAIERREATVPNVSDSAAIKNVMLLALDLCEGREALRAFSDANGTRSDKWELLTTEDQEEVAAAFSRRVAEIKAQAA